MTDSRDLIQRLIDALKEECDWINNPKHDELIAEALVHLKRTSPVKVKYDSCLLELRARVEELERRLDKQEEYAQEQND